MQKVKFVCRHGFSWLARPPTLVHEPVREHGGADQDLLQEVTAKDVGDVNLAKALNSVNKKDTLKLPDISNLRKNESVDYLLSPANENYK